MNTVDPKHLKKITDAVHAIDKDADWKTVLSSTGVFVSVASRGYGMGGGYAWVETRKVHAGMSPDSVLKLIEKCASIAFARRAAGEPPDEEEDRDLRERHNTPLLGLGV